MKKRKVSVRKVAAMIVEMVIDGIKGLPKAEQERRIRAFCDDAEKVFQRSPPSSAEERPRPKR